MSPPRSLAAAVLLTAGLALFAGRPAAGDDTAGKPALEVRVDAIERKFAAELRQAEDRMQGELDEMKGELKRMEARLDSCEAETATFGQAVAVIDSRRRVQAEARCQGHGLQTMLSACCLAGTGGGGGHRRELQDGCSGFPASCSTECADLFVEYYGGCQDIIATMPAVEKAEFDSFYGQCNEAAQVAAAMDGASPAMIYHVLVVNPVGSTGGGEPSVPSPPTSPTEPGGAVAAQEFRRVCTSVNLATCVPQCNALTYGFLLSIEIDGRGTVLTCNKVDRWFSWQGQASLGGYIGADFNAFFSSVVSGAAGTYLAILDEDRNVHTDMVIEPGQAVKISGNRSMRHNQ